MDSSGLHIETPPSSIEVNVTDGYEQKGGNTDIERICGGDYGRRSINRVCRRAYGRGRLVGVGKGPKG